MTKNKYAGLAVQDADEGLVGGSGRESARIAPDGRSFERSDEGRASAVLDNLTTTRSGNGQNAKRPTTEPPGVATKIAGRVIEVPTHEEREGEEFKLVVYQKSRTFGNAPPQVPIPCDDDPRKRAAKPKQKKQRPAVSNAKLSDATGGANMGLAQSEGGNGNGNDGSSLSCRPAPRPNDLENQNLDWREWCNCGIQMQHDIRTDEMFCPECDAQWEDGALYAERSSHGDMTGRKPTKSGSRSITAVETTTYNKPGEHVNTQDAKPVNRFQRALKVDKRKVEADVEETIEVPLAPVEARPEKHRTRRAGKKRPVTFAPEPSCPCCPGDKDSSTPESRANKKLDYLMTEEGQQELMQMIKEEDAQPVQKSLSVMTVKSPKGQPLSAVDSTQWVRIDITADTGACDSVMPREGPWENIEIVPSEMSRREDEYEVANAESIPNLGERHLAIWPEGSSQPRHICMQVADVHKPLLSLSRCADLGFESRFGKSAGALVDGHSGEVIPLHRVGNLYMLRAWIRAAPNKAQPFGRQR